MIDAREFRDTVGCFATGITVITTVDGDGNPVGLTANSFSSVSLDPPLVLFCLDRTVASFAAFEEGGEFAVNILAAEQMDLSNRFAKSGEDKWDGVEYETWSGNAPILPNCIANMECRTAKIFDGGDHIIVTGEVKKLANDEGEPLLYWRGRYATLIEQS